LPLRGIEIVVDYVTGYYDKIRLLVSNSLFRPPERFLVAVKICEGKDLQVSTPRLVGGFFVARESQLRYTRLEPVQMKLKQQSWLIYYA